MLTRRQLLQLGAAASARAAANPRITRVEVFPVRYPVAAHFKFLKGDRPAVFVKITCESGAAGWGQSVPIPTWSYETVESVVVTLEKYLAPVLIGRDPLDIAGAHTAMDRAISPSFSTGMPICKAGVDLALHDLAGRLQAKSVPELWGRVALPRIPLSWTVNPTSLEEVESLVQQGFSRGYRHFNVKIAPDARFDLEMCRRVRKLAPNAFLWADANGGYDVETALAVAPKLADIGVNVLEQPVAANRLSGFRALKKQKALPIILDEGVVSSVELEEFLKLEMADGVAMKPARTAGLFDARKQIEIVQREGLMFLGSGLTDPDTALAAALQLYGAYRLQYPAALNGPQFLEGSYLRRPLEVKDGAIEVPGGPGLGVEPQDVTRPVARHAASAGGLAFAFREAGPSSLELALNGRPLLIYNHGMMLKEGVPADRRRACYIHPLYASDGTLLTDDFPRDHYHHRGLSWMWPVVNIGGRRHDLWMVRGIEQRFVRWLARETGRETARLAVENGWYAGERRVMKEEIEIRAGAEPRRIDLTLRFEPLERLEIGGSPDGKGYGGLSLRFAPRQQTVIRTDAGIESRDSDMAPHPWAQLEGLFEGRRAGVRVEIDPGNPGFPNGWCLRHYGFLGVNYPGLTPVPLTPGRLLEMRYRITFPV